MRPAKFRYRVISVEEAPGIWLKAADKTEIPWYAKTHLPRRHLEVQRRCAKPNSDGSARYAAYGFVTPDGTWTYSTQLTPDQYLKET